MKPSNRDFGKNEDSILKMSSLFLETREKRKTDAAIAKSIYC